MQSFLFGSILSLVIKNRMYTKTLNKKYHDPSIIMNQHKLFKAEFHKKKKKKDHAGNLEVIYNKGIVYFEMLPSNQTINSDVYCQHLMKIGGSN